MSGMSAIGGMQAGMMRGFQPPSFSSIDTNSDGGITLDELKSNAPGGVSSAESDKRAQELFTQMDSDSDGTVTSAEKDAFDAQMADRMAQMQFAAQMIHSGSPEAAAAEDIVSALDGDSDGAVSLEELSASDIAEDLSTEELEELFAALDSDEDGSVTEEEVSSFLEDNKPAGPPPQGAGGPPPPPPPGGQEPEGSDALGMLKAAISAYQSSASGSETTSLTDLLEEAA